jgi:hypothetical protein
MKTHKIANKIANDACGALRHEIMLCMKANNVPVTGEAWLSFVFRSESELQQMCAELNIHVK